MAMELHVLSDRQLNSAAEWQHAINKEAYPLQLDSDFHLGSVKGFLFAKLSGSRTGFECFHDDALETMTFLGKDHFGHRWKYALGFRWRGSNIDELQASWMAATAYAAATAGIIFDHEAGRSIAPQEARRVVGNIVRDTPRLESLLAEIKKQFEKKA
jgi:hypothetical protein